MILELLMVFISFFFIFFFMIRRPPRSTRTDTLFPLHDALPISSDPYDSALNLNNRNRYEGGGGGLTIQYDLGFAKLVSTTGYRRYSFSTIADTDGSTDAADDLQDRKSTRLNSSH